MTDGSNLSLFDETASAVGNFPRALNGYDRQAVNEYVLTLEQKLSQSRDQLHTLKRQLADVSARPEPEPVNADFTHLGAHATEILRVAQVQAKELTDRAAVEADRLREEARRTAGATIAKGERDADDIRMTSVSELRELRASLDRQASEQIHQSKAEGDKLLAASQQHADSVTREATRKAAAMLEAARLEAANVRQEAEREAADMRAKSAKERELLLAKLKSEHDEAAAASAKMLEEATKTHDETKKTIATEVANATKMRTEALAEAERIKITATREAEIIINEARKKAEELRRKTEEQSAYRNEELTRENEMLNQRKRAIMAQLASLSAMARQSASEYPDIEPLGNDEAQPEEAERPVAEAPLQRPHDAAEQGAPMKKSADTKHAEGDGKAKQGNGSRK